MENGIYTATTGLLTRSKSIDIIGNNLTNSNTAGFKRDGMVTSDFGEYMTYKIGSDGSVKAIGDVTRGSLAKQVYTDQDQGSFDTTGRNLDIAIQGDGFFTLRENDGTTVLSRNGRFEINDNGYLTNYSGALVLGNNGPIRLGTSTFSVRGNGEIYVGNTYVDKLRIVNPVNNRSLVKLGDGNFQNAGAETPFTGQIVQGSYERSNVNVSQEMTDMIANSRSYQTCGQALKMMDKILERTVNDIARV